MIDAFLSKVLQSVAAVAGVVLFNELEKKKNSKAELIYVSGVETSFHQKKVY